MSGFFPFVFFFFTSQDFVMADALASTSPPPAVAVFGSPPRPLPLDVLRGTLPMHPLNFPQ